MRPSFSTLPPIAYGRLVSTASMMYDAYSLRALVPQRPVRHQLVAHPLPSRDLAHAAAGVLVQRDVEPLDQLGVPGLDEPRHVLGAVLAALGDVVAEPAHDLVAHPVSVRHLPRRGAAPDLGVEILPAGGVISSSHAWWLMPAIFQSVSGFHAMPTPFTRVSAHTCTLWHRPTARMPLARSRAPVTMAMGFT